MDRGGGEGGGGGGGGGADLALSVRFFSVAPEVVMEGPRNLVTFFKIYLKRFSKKPFLVTMDCVTMATKLSEGSQDKKSIYFSNSVLSIKTL